MAKSTPKPNLNGLIGGYLRISDVKYPDDCDSAPDKELFIDKLRRVRMSELIQDAARDGCKIDIWYDDIDVSGTAKNLIKRLAYQEMIKDARARKLRAVYARDLSRLGRFLIEQESFFLQLERFAVDVRVADLPSSGDPAARILVRQQLGSLNQYMATKNGQVIKQTNRERVRMGQWVGRTRNEWGLRYNKQTKFFDFDPETADYARLVYETFIKCRGFARQTALRLNELHREGHPRASLAPRGGMWTGTTVLRLVQSATYRRKICYEDLVIDVSNAPEKIPEVIPQDLIAEADRILTVRAPLNAIMSEKHKAGRLDNTYGGILFCHHCGFRMTALRNPDSRGGRGPVRWLSWVCGQGSDGERRLCKWKLSIQQYRLDSLVGEGLRMMLDLYERENFAPTSDRRVKHPSPKSTTAEALALLDQRRNRLLGILETCEPEALETINKRLKAIADERIKLKETPTVAAELEEAAIATLTRREWSTLSARLNSVWKTPDDMLSHEKHDLLKTLQVKVVVNILPRETKRRKEGNARTYAGLLGVQLHVGALGMKGDQALRLLETKDAYEAYNVWKCRDHACQRIDP